VTALPVLAALVALAGPAHAYPEPSCPASVSSQHVTGGATFTVTGTSSVPRDWTVTFDGQHASTHGTSMRFAFRAPVVSTTTTLAVHVSCGGGDQVIPVTVVPPGSAAPGVHEAARSSSLPHTGGPARGLLAAGVALVVAGLGVLALRRRGRAAAR
jgi:LPXTG-motif cell wall-anchored protein